jgi:hypothetical protein
MTSLLGGNVGTAANRVGGAAHDAAEERCIMARFRRHRKRFLAIAGP